MGEAKDTLKWIPIEELKKELYNIYNFGYYDSKGKKLYKDFCEEIQTLVLNRLGSLFTLSKYVLIEDDYIETEWKTMISKHYINSAYASSIKSRVIRIHFLSNIEFNSECYLGFITLRPVAELSIALSFIYLNWSNAFFEMPSFVMTYKKTVHHKGQSVEIDTYPFFSQDSIVTCCADVSILMLTSYLSNKHGFSNVPLSNIIETSKQFRRQIPKKVSLFEIRSILNEQKIYHLDYQTDCFNPNTEYIINAYLESALPVLFLIEDHVIQMVGYSYDNEGYIKDYIVYDDSGYLDDKISIEKSNEKRFFYATTFSRVRNYLEELSKKSGKQTMCYIIVPIFDKVYIDIETYLNQLHRHIKNLNDNSREKGIEPDVMLSAFQALDLSKESPPEQKIHIRNFLVDNSVLKGFIKEKIYPHLLNKLSSECDLSAEAISSKVSYIIDFLGKSLSHYIWFTELKKDSECVCFCADSTMYYETMDDISLFLGFSPTYYDEIQELNLLTKSNK